MVSNKDFETDPPIVTVLAFARTRANVRRAAQVNVRYTFIKIGSKFRKNRQLLPLFWNFILIAL